MDNGKKALRSFLFNNNTVVFFIAEQNVQKVMVYYVLVIGLCEDDAVRQERAIRHDGPYFDEGVTKNVTAQLGAHAYLPCKVYNLKDKSVSL